LGNQLSLQVGDLDRATHPPTFLLLFEPLTVLAPHAAYWLWAALNFVCLIAALALLQSALPLRFRLLLFPLALLYEPVSSHFHWGQANLPVLLLLAGLVRCLECRRDGLGGTLLSLATLMRMFPLILVGYLLLQKKWRAVWYFVMGVSALGILTIVLAGIAQSLHYSDGMRVVTAEKWLTYTNNISVRAFITRLLLTTDALRQSSVQALRWVIILAAQLGILAATTRLTIAAPSGKDDHSRLLSLWIATSILLSPTAWDHYMVLLFVMFYSLTGAVLKGAAMRRAIYAAFASYICSDSPFILSSIGVWPAHGWLQAAFYEKDFVAMSLAYVAAYWFAHDIPAGEPILES